jgi:hypothetical protein
MDTLKTFMETLKLTLYEILALLLPGAILVEAARELPQRPLTVNTTNSTGIIYFLVLSYVGGLAAQGITNLIFRRVPNLLRTGHLSTIPPKRKQPLEAHARAKRVVEKLIGTKVDDEFVEGYCLSSLSTSRAYDRFLALRDMARALFLAFPVAWWVFASGAHWPLASKFIGVLAGTIGFLERYFRFDRAADEALFTQFLADSHHKDRQEKEEAAEIQKEKGKETQAAA